MDYTVDIICPLYNAEKYIKISINFYEYGKFNTKKACLTMLVCKI